MNRKIVAIVGLLIVVGIMFFYIVQPRYSWISPNGYEDLSSVWSGEDKAYDSDLASDAHTDVGSYRWSGWLVLRAPFKIRCGTVKFFASTLDFDSYDRVQIEVSTEDGWLLVFKNDFVDEEWCEICFEERVVDGARVCFYNREGIPFVRVHLYEFEFYGLEA